MKKNLSTLLLFASIIFFVSCSKDDDSTKQVETLGNAKRATINSYSDQGSLSGTLLYEFSYNEHSLISAIRLTDDQGVKNRTINYNSDKKVSQIIQTAGNTSKTATITYNGKNVTMTFSDQTNPVIYTFNDTNNSFDFSNGTEYGTLIFGENDNIVEITVDNTLVISKKIVANTNGIYANQDRLLSLISVYLDNSNYADLLFFDRNALSSLKTDNASITINNEFEKGSLTYCEMINNSSQIKFADVTVTY